MEKKIFFLQNFITDGTFYEIWFLKKYGSLCCLLTNLATRKTTVSSANIDKIFFIINLIHEYND